MNMKLQKGPAYIISIVIAYLLSVLATESIQFEKGKRGKNKCVIWEQALGVAVENGLYGAFSILL